MEDEVDPEKEEELLKEGEVSQEEQEELSSEEILRKYVGNESFENEGTNLADLDIKSPKDYQSDDERFEPDPKFMENANDSYSCKISTENSFESTRQEIDSTNYQGEPEHHLSSKATDDALLIEEGEGEEEGEEDEVQVMKGVKGGEEKQETGGGGGEGSDVRGGQYLATADIRCKEVTSSKILI